MLVKIITPRDTKAEERQARLQAAHDEWVQGQLARLRAAYKRAIAELPPPEKVQHARAMLAARPVFMVCCGEDVREAGQWRPCKLHRSEVVHPLGKPSPATFLLCYFTPVVQVVRPGPRDYITTIDVYGPVKVSGEWTGDVLHLVPNRLMHPSNYAAELLLKRLLARAQGRRYEGISPVTGAMQFYFEDDSIAEVMGGERPWLEPHEMKGERQ